MTVKKDKIIRITCTGAGMLPLEALKPLQGDMKTLTRENYKKLKEAIIKHGFSFPEAVWKDGDVNWIIDGHQRVKTVTKMLEEGYTLQRGKLPVTYVEAADKKEASELLLLATSQFGIYDEARISEFINTAGLDFSSLKLKMELPQINLEKLEIGWFSGEAKPEDNPKEEEKEKESENKCPKCGFEWSGKKGAKKDDADFE